VGLQTATSLYPTPQSGIQIMISDLYNDYYDSELSEVSFLEPSAGTGNIVRAMIDFGNAVKHIDAVEYDPSLAKVLQTETKITNVFNQDFLEFQPTRSYDYILMNPPFNKTTWLRHLLKALSIGWKLGNNSTKIYIICPTAIENYYTSGALKTSQLKKSEQSFAKQVGLWDESRKEVPPIFVEKLGTCDDFVHFDNGKAKKFTINTGIYKVSLEKFDPNPIAMQKPNITWENGTKYLGKSNIVNYVPPAEEDPDSDSESKSLETKTTNVNLADSEENEDEED